MAYAEKMEAKRGTTYRACWSVPGRKTAVKKGGFATKKEAKQYAETQEADARRRGAPRSDATQILFREWAEEWYASIDLEPSTMRGYLSVLRNHLIRTWGEWKLTDLANADHQVATWKKGLLGHYTEGSVDRIVGILVTMLNDAVDQGVIHRTPVVPKRRRGKVAPRRQKRKQERYEHITDPLGVFLIAERCAHMSGRDDEFVLVLAKYWLGLRWGEVIGLTRESVTTRFYMDKQLHEYPGNLYYWKDPKDGSSRDIDVPPFLVSLLSGQVERVSHPEVSGRWCPCGESLAEKYRHAPGVHLFAGMGDDYHLRSNPFRNSIFYPAARGTHHAGAAAFPVYLSDAKDPWSTVPTGKGLRHPSNPAGQWDPICEGMKIHGLRHSHRPLLEEIGTPKVLIDERMGHSDSSVVGRYSHVTESMREDLLGRLQGRWEDAVRRRGEMNLESPVPLVREILGAHSRSTPDLESRRGGAIRGRVA